MWGRLRFYRDLWRDRLRAALGDVPLDCGPGRFNEQDARRPSPTGSVRFEVGDREALLCYGRPSARDRKVFGELLPWGQLWRLGANWPTTLHLPFACTIGGLRVGRGKLSLYTVPHERGDWTLVLNRSTRQWGPTVDQTGLDGNFYRSAYTDLVRRQEIGRVPVSVEVIPYVEQLTVSVVGVSARETVLGFDWETTRLLVPIALP